MENVLIYGGAALMLVGCIFGLVGAVKGFCIRKGLSAFMPDFNAKIDPDIKKFVILWAVLMIVGFTMVVIGITLGL